MRILDAIFGIKSHTLDREGSTLRKALKIAGFQNDDPPNDLALRIKDLEKHEPRVYAYKMNLFYQHLEEKAWNKHQRLYGNTFPCNVVYVSSYPTKHGHAVVTFMFGKNSVKQTGGSSLFYNMLQTVPASFMTSETFGELARNNDWKTAIPKISSDDRRLKKSALQWGSEQGMPTLLGSHPIVFLKRYSKDEEGEQMLAETSSIHPFDGQARWKTSHSKHSENVAWFSSLHFGKHPVKLVDALNVALAPIPFRVWYAHGALLERLQKQIFRDYGEAKASQNLTDKDIRTFFETRAREELPELQRARFLLRLGDRSSYAISRLRKYLAPNTAAERSLAMDTRSNAPARNFEGETARLLIARQRIERSNAPPRRGFRESFKGRG